MSAPSIRVQPVRKPVLPAQTTPEQRYWRGFKNPVLVKEYNAISHIHFNPVSPHDFAVTSSTRIQIFSAKTRQVTKTISRFKDTVYSGEFRADGKLIVAGDATGLIQIFDVSSRSILATLNPSQHPTHVTKFHPSNLQTLLSASDDKVARLWDITSSTPIASFQDHTDYIRTATFIPSSDFIATGCYDGIVRIYDPRTPSSSGPITTFNQGAPVESVLALNPTTLVTSGGPSVKVWDMVAGKMIKDLSNFQKTVTCLASAGERGLIAGSLDGHVKVFDTLSSKWDVKFGWKFGGGVLSTGVSPNFKHFATGLTSGLLSIRTRKTDARVKQGVKQDKSGNYARMIRGAEYHGETEHRVIDGSVKPKKKLRTYERHINAFRWGDALDSAFNPGMPPELTVTVLEELKKRGKVSVSLSGRDEASLEPLLKWASKAIQDIRCVYTVADWVGCVVDMYGSLISRSPILEELVFELRRKLAGEIEKAKDARKIEGMLELLIG
ncbi:WD40 repeat-like protein [Nadsonia fulvescens var. elongata DSM 6958]|uniref:WD40 repeat-like protein n=1 Tax=Nadsonia fulvescens var. elongata DSM 6958 TaxID=857566 RepID=A0A1E3PQU6_9ASCO|nr:WD40 repeat-like protein [Nadsonia fulvescens var. elongata DSM 6958]